MSDSSKEEKLAMLNQFEVQQVGHDANGVPYVLVKSNQEVVDVIKRLSSDSEGYLRSKGVIVSEWAYLEDSLAKEFFNIAPLAYDECGAHAFIDGKFV